MPKVQSSVSSGGLGIFLSIPEELILNILSTLDQQTLCIIALASKPFRQISDDYTLWLPLIKKKFVSMAESYPILKFSKQMYIELSKTHKLVIFEKLFCLVSGDENSLLTASKKSIDDRLFILKDIIRNWYLKKPSLYLLEMPVEEEHMADHLNFFSECIGAKSQHLYITTTNHKDGVRSISEEFKKKITRFLDFHEKPLKITIINMIFETQLLRLLSHYLLKGKISSFKLITHIK